MWRVGKSGSACSAWMLVLLSPALLLLVLPLLLDLMVMLVVKVVVKLCWRLPGKENFRVTGSRIVRPLQQTTFTHQLSILDKMTIPLFYVCFNYFYEEDLDEDLLCRALSNIVTSLPFLGGRIKGILPLSRIECDGNAGVEVVLAETSYSLRDVHLHGDSPAMQRLSRIHATGFGAGDPWDNLSPAFSWWSGGAPVMRVRVTKLAGGGTALGVSASHIAMDGETLKKVVELWAKEARRLSSMPEETGDVHGHWDRKEDEEGMDLTYTPKELGLLDTSVMNNFIDDAAKGLQGMTLRRFFYDYLHFNKQTLWVFAWWFCLGGSGSKTFFFADDVMATTKAQVMEELKASGDSGKPSFVSTNDIICAMVWQAMRRATSWYPGRSTCVSLVSVRERLVQKDFKGTKNADRFLFGNACLQARAAHVDTASASVLELASLIRDSLQSMTPAKVHEQLGRHKARDQILGLLTGPDFSDINVNRDVIFSAFSPLEGDTDFGRGPAYFYHLDTTPSAFLVHPNKGYDHNDGKRKGTYVTVLAARPTLRGLSKHLGDFLPAAPVASPLVVKVA